MTDCGRNYEMKLLQKKRCGRLYNAAAVMIAGRFLRKEALSAVDDDGIFSTKSDT